MKDNECPIEYAVWDDGEWDATHRCRLDAGHPGLHHCPDCGVRWLENSR